jgi:hypothetical protein
VRLVLSQDDADLLERGEVSTGAWIGGGAAALWIGMGVGQAVQGRWSDTGWIFTLGEPAAVVAVIYGAVESFKSCPLVSPAGQSCDTSISPWFWGGLIAVGGLRIWEVVDAFAGPPSDNRHLRDLRQRLGLAPPPPAYGMRPYVAPGGAHGGGVAGLTLRF